MNASDVPGRGTGPTTAADRRGPRVSRALLGGAALLLLALAVVGLVLAGGPDDAGPTGAGDAAATSTQVPGSPTAPSSGPPSSGPSEAPSGGPSAAPSGGPAAPAPAGSAEDLPPALPAVALDEPVAVEEEVTASIALVEEIDGRATGPGDVAGPALRITVRIANGTGGDLDLDGVVVNLTHGPEGTPAPPLDDPSRSPFAGLLPAGDAAEGVYVFRIPADLADDVTVEVGYRAGGARAIFSGPVR